MENSNQRYEILINGFTWYINNLEYIHTSKIQLLETLNGNLVECSVTADERKQINQQIDSYRVNESNVKLQHLNRTGIYNI